MIRTILTLITALGVLGCTPITLDNDPPIDFDVYRSVYVPPLQGEGFAAERAFFVNRLREDSGFRRVTTNPADEVDAVLIVAVRLVDIDIDFDDDDREYETEAQFRLEDAVTGKVIDRGTVEDDSSASYEDALEEALDDVVLHYLKPYRL